MEHFKQSSERRHGAASETQVVADYAKSHGSVASFRLRAEPSGCVECAFASYAVFIECEHALYSGWSGTVIMSAYVTAFGPGSLTPQDPLKRTRNLFKRSGPALYQGRQACFEGGKRGCRGDLQFQGHSVPEAHGSRCSAPLVLFRMGSVVQCT